MVVDEFDVKQKRLQMGDGGSVDQQKNRLKWQVDSAGRWVMIQCQPHQHSACLPYKYNYLKIL